MTRRSSSINQFYLAILIQNLKITFRAFLDVTRQLCKLSVSYNPLERKVLDFWRVLLYYYNYSIVSRNFFWLFPSLPHQQNFVKIISKVLHIHVCVSTDLTPLHGRFYTEFQLSPYFPFVCPCDIEEMEYELMQSHFLLEIQNKTSPANVNHRYYSFLISSRFDGKSKAPFKHCTIDFVLILLISSFLKTVVYLLLQVVTESFRNEN